MTSPKSDLMLFPAHGLIDNDSASTVASFIRVKKAGRLSVVDSVLIATTAINAGLTSQPLINIYRSTVSPATTLNPTVGLVGVHDFKNTPFVALEEAGTIYHCSAIGRLGGQTVSPGKKIAGTISVTAASATVTGVGTNFDPVVSYGDVICTEGGQVARVQARSSDTSITADKNFATTETGADCFLTAPNARDGDDLANGWVGFAAGDYIWAAISTEGVGGTVAGAFQAFFALKFDETVVKGHYLT